MRQSGSLPRMRTKGEPQPKKFLAQSMHYGPGMKEMLHGGDGPLAGSVRRLHAVSSSAADRLQPRTYRYTSSRMTACCGPAERSGLATPAPRMILELDHTSRFWVRLARLLKMNIRGLGPGRLMVFTSCLQGVEVCCSAQSHSKPVRQLRIQVHSRLPRTRASVLDEVHVRADHRVG